MNISMDAVKELAQKLGFKGDLKELQMGIAEEYKEHIKTINKYSTIYPPIFAAAIAIDHLNEDPHYYTKLQHLKGPMHYTFEGTNRDTRLGRESIR